MAACPHPDVVRPGDRSHYPKWRGPPRASRSGRPRGASRRPRGWSRRWCRGRTPRRWAETSLATMRSTFLPRSLAAARVAMSWVSAANPTRTCPSRRRRPSSARMSGVGSSTSSGTPSDFDSLVSAGVFDRKSATAAAMTTTSAPRAVLEHGRFHLRRRLHPARPSMPAGTARRRRGHEHDVRAACRGRFGHGVALLARRAVGDEPHGVDRLSRAAGAHHARAVPARSRPRRRAESEHRQRRGRRCRPARPGDRPRRRRPPAGPRPAPPRARGADAAWPGCPAPQGAPTSRCAWPGTPSPAHAWPGPWR